MTTIVLHIDRLVLHGVPLAQRAAWLRRFEAELRVALAEPGAARDWAAAGTQPRLRRTLPAPDAGAGADEPALAARALAQAPKGGAR